ncbi:MAG: hypothetical protein E7400_01690 [Ruminococcaceae bacterium]|nr:hypothetical protein [Oscillospiraceae bacterium]
MKNKSLILILLCAMIIMSITFIYRDTIGNQISIWIDNRLDYERTMDVGDKFNKVVWGDFTIQINHYKSGNKLEYVKNEEKTSLLETVKNYKILENKLYVVAGDGYAVVDENNIVKIYLTSGNEFILDNVIYLTSLDDFEENEQRILKKL